MPFCRWPAIAIATGLSIIAAPGTGRAGQTAASSGGSTSGTGAAGAQAAPAGGSISAPPANSAMRRAGASGGAPAAAASGRNSGTTSTNAMTLTSDQGQNDMQGGGAQQQRGSGRSGTQQAPSIDSNGLIQRGGTSPPR